MVSARTKPYQLLIADDDQSFRETLRQVFEPFLRTIEVESGEEAVKLFGSQRIDIVLIDMHMHVMTGLDALRIVKTIDAVVPCILVTADATEQLIRDASLADVYSVLSKPVRRAELMATVSTALEEAYSDPDAFADLGRN